MIWGRNRASGTGAQPNSLKDKAMPYGDLADLPESVREHLPHHAQEIYLAAFNAAWRLYRKREPDRIEEIAHRVAWAAVKKRYRKQGHDWVEAPR
jgi:cation transport regulator